MPALRRAAGASVVVSLLAGGLSALAVAPASAVPGPDSTVFINEIHYDNASTDVGEFVEVAGPAGTDLTGWSIVLYNGNGGAPYATTALSGSIPSQAGGYGTVSVDAAGIQNGAPDAVALVNSSTLVQFLSYEGTFAGVGGAADGQTSTDIGVAEAGTEAVGQSLQLTGTGTTYGDFTWTGPTAQSPAAANTGQTFGTPSNDLTATDPGDVEVTVDEPITPITLEARGGTAPYSWEFSGLPAGLGETSDGTIGGTPTETGEFTITATVTDSAEPAATDEVQFALTVSEPVEPTAIADIQGTGDTSPLAGQTVTTEGVVTAVYDTGGKNGFVIQTAGAEPGTASHGLFVYTYNGTRAGLVDLGDAVEVTGEVSEYNGLTELTAGSDGDIVKTGTGTITPAAVSWPATEAARESLESMLVDLSGQQFTVSNNYSTNRYGEVGLATGDTPLITPTEVANPSETEAYDAVVADNAARGVILDDGASTDYQTNAAAKDQPLPWIDQDITARVGADATLDAPVVVDYGFDAWRVQPTGAVTGVQPDLVTFEDTRPDNATPQDVGGDITVATFNVLNYFNTTGMDWVESGRGTCTYYTDRAGDEVTDNRCEPDGPRGAAEDEDLTRQQDKIVAAINALDASVVSLEEIENSLALGEADRDDALAELTTALNDAAGEERWAFVPSPDPADLPASEDVIRTAFIYDPSAVSLDGDSVIFDDPAFANARQPLAQAFVPVAGAESDAFAVIVNHFKSKGSACDGEPEGPQGNCNESRVAQAEALAQFADDFATERGLEKEFLTGDFNSYTREDPMLALEDAGWTQLTSDTADEWSYSFDGQSGSLDHVLANDAALAAVTGVDIWEINANEAIAYEYSRHNYNVTDFYAPDVYRASDHNPEIVGIDVTETAQPATAHVKVDVRPDRVKAKKTRPRVWVRVRAEGAPATGQVAFRVQGRGLVAVKRLDDGRAHVRLARFQKPGRYRLTVVYRGSETVARAKDVSQIRVVRR
ncbi:ExeM/NucH family extracellular endonuclease [Nocardioides aestuarii]|uniref:ExeM/NucH family extracellular endonuclease n=1 Tax=Nocardioides aestuarii TaxID=252231 RepID=A0ABW4TR86_9ACTN